MIRPAVASDAPALADLLNHWIIRSAITFTSVPKTETDLTEMIAAKAGAGHGFFVAVAGDRLLGQASYGQFRAGNGYARAMEHTIILADTARGRGLGRALMTAVEDHARARNRHSMIAGVSGGNPDGRAFHAAIGYDLVATVPQVGWKFGRYWDLWLMQKILT